MLTEFGKALRKIRIDRQQLLRDMADKLGVSSAYLSAVETGKRRIPQDWVSKIASIYSLSCEEQADLQSAADNSVFDVTISLVNASEQKRNAVLSFARALDGLNDEDLKRIMASMKGKEEKRGNRQRARDKSLVKLALPRDRNSIRRSTYLLRQKLGLKDTPYFPIVEFLENVLPEIDPTFHIEILEDLELPGVQAEYVPSLNVVRIKNSVYEAAVSGYWWARSTLAHELGHYYFHDEKSVRYAKLDPCKKVPPDFDPERQANVFAAELLAPIDLIGGLSEREIGSRCGVSYQIAKRQLRVLERIRLRKEGKRRAKKRRPSSKA